MDIGGSGILEYNSNSLFQILSNVYPQYDWLPWQFEYFRCPSNYWENPQNQQKYMDWAAKQLNVKETQDWYKITGKVYSNM